MLMLQKEAERWLHKQDMHSNCLLTAALIHIPSGKNLSISSYRYTPASVCALKFENSTRLVSLKGGEHIIIFPLASPIKGSEASGGTSAFLVGFRLFTSLC